MIRLWRLTLNFAPGHLTLASGEYLCWPVATVEGIALAYTPEQARMLMQQETSEAHWLNPVDASCEEIDVTAPKVVLKQENTG